MARHRSTVLALLAVLATFSACATEQRAVHMVKLSGDRALERGQYELAVSEYREVLERRPGRANAHFDLGRALLRIGKPAEARDHLEVAYTLAPNDPEVIQALAEAMADSGAHEDMARFLRQVIEERPTVPNWIRLGNMLARVGDIDSATSALRTAATVDGGRTIEPQLALARLYRAIGDDAAALDRYRMAIYLDPANTEANNAIRAFGEIPGPSFALPPAELASADVQ